MKIYSFENNVNRVRRKMTEAPESHNSESNNKKDN